MKREFKEGPKQDNVITPEENGDEITSQLEGYFKKEEEND